jgi:hypothetical protein
VAHGVGSDWSYIRVPRIIVARWLNSETRKPTDKIYSRLSAVYDEELWLFVGSPLYQGSEVQR